MKGAVAAGHPLTAEAGARALAAGGNAVDACVAAAFVSWVAESPLTGPGAGGFMLVHRARDRTDFLLDFFAAVPGAGIEGRSLAALEHVDVPFGSADTTQTFLIGPASCAVPGMLAGLGEAHRRYGTVPWPELVAPAARLARDGVELAPSQAFLHEILDRVLRHDPDGCRVYGAERPLRVGDRLVMRDLAATLDRLAHEGAESFYRGELAAAISQTVLERGGRLTLEDLAAYRVVRRRPVRSAYRGSDLVTNPPPSAGGLLVAFALRVLDRLPPGGPGSADAIVRLAAAAREAARARDGSFASELGRGGLAARLLADERIESALAGIVDGRGPFPEPAGLPSTTHVSVVDARGNATSMSSSTGVGSGVIVPGTGIHLNNMLGETDLNPSGREPRTGRRLMSMMAPSMLLSDGRPRLVIGSAGSERLRGAIVQVVVNVVDHGLPLREAIDAPRTHLDGSDVHCEAGTDPAVTDRLERRGHDVVRWPGEDLNLYFGGVSAVSVGPDGSLEAAGDPRRGGHGIVVD